MTGDTIVYSVLEDGELYDDPESVIYSVKYNGKGEKTLSDVMDGLISFIVVYK